MQFRDLQKQYEVLKPQIDEAMVKVAASAHYISGPEIKELEKALAELGLTRREANEFIVYWLPLMEKNNYNVISFQTKTYEENAKLFIDPKPDTMIRIFMTWYGSKKPVEVSPQTLSAPERDGFVVVEWGGSEVRP